MRRVRTVCLAAILVGCAATGARSQESFFASQFLGVSEETAGGRARALGIMGVGLDDKRTSLTFNPGALGGLKQMTFSATGITGTRRSTDGTLEHRSGMARFPHVRVALPLFGKVVASAGFVGMRNFRAAYLLPRNEVDGLGYRQRFERDGTLYQIPVGVSGSLGSRFHIGATWDFVLGTIDERWITEGDSIVAINSRRRDGMSGQTVTLGFVARPFRRLSVGASWSPQFDIDRSRRSTLEDARANTVTLPLRDASVQSKFTYPQVIRAGGAIDLGYSSMLAADYMWRDWNAYTGDLYEAEGVGSETRYGGGFEWSPQPRVHYRVGASHWTWPQSLGGERLQEKAIHGGIGIDVKVDGGRLDISVEHAWIGSLERNGGEERVWRVLISVAGQEEWRRKSPRAQ